MKKSEVELLTDVGNDAVLRLPGRSYPGVLLQGDSLNGLVKMANDALRALEQGATDAARDELTGVVQRLADAQQRYEAALRAGGIALPY